ncbi:MAG: FAD-binding protein, partial [Patescibacteria group bacterium]|nr:FAD-binding protein [Patescibacteria group bacterium]
MTDIEQHTARVRSVQESMRSFHARKQKVKIYHGTTNSTRAQHFEKDAYVDVSVLNKIIEIHEEERYALVEPNVPMDALVEETLRYGLLPPVVPEFPGITVGGAVQGGA